jgi:RHS repeat-associated protein
VLWKYGYDRADQLISAVKHATDTPQTVLKRYAYAYDPAGNRTVEQIDDVVMLSAYDNLNRLTSQAPGGPMVIAGTLNEPGTVTISGKPATVDANNNFRGTVQTTSGTNAFTIVAKDATGNTTTQQYEIDLAGSTRSFTYDANGNTTSDGGRSYSWNALDKLVLAQAGSESLTLSYAGSGMLSRRTLSDNSLVVADTSYILERTRVVEYRAATTGTILMQPFAKGYFTPSELEFEVHDPLGSVVAVTDESGNLVQRNEFDPFGRMTVSGTSSSTQGFGGHRGERDFGLVAAPYRLYDASLGRWLNRDPLGDVDGPNQYAYVRGNPTSKVDPTGLRIRCMVAGIRSIENVSEFAGGCDKAAGACTSIESIDGPAGPCRPRGGGGCIEQYGFDAFVGMSILVEYRIPPNAPNRETPGATMRQHENLHVADFVGNCRDLNDRVQSEGFLTMPQCEAALKAINSRLQRESERFSEETRMKNDRRRR